MANVFKSAAELFAAQGRDLGITDWVEMRQQRIDQFADATGDHQWIHVDPEKAKSGPFGACIAHGYLTLTPDVEFVYKVDNLYSREHDRSIRFDDPDIGVNWGIESPELSDKDRNAPLFKDSGCSFVYDVGGCK